MRSLLKIILFLLILLRTGELNSQVSIGWVARFSGGISGDVGLAITVDDNDNAYVTGNSYGNQTRRDLVVIKYSSAGVNLWTKRIADTVNNGYMSGRDIQMDEFNNVIVGGSGIYKYDSKGNLLWSNTNVGCYVFDFDSAGNVYTISGNTYYITRKLNLSGVILWERIYPGYQVIDPNRPYDMCIDKENNVLVTGKCRQAAGVLNDYATVKYSNTGNLIWERRYNGGNEDIAYAIACDDSNNVYVTGWNKNISTDILTIKYSPEGDTVWKAVYDGGGFDVGYDIEVDSLGCVYVGGVSSGTYITIKYNVNGSLLWSRSQPLQVIPEFPILKLDISRNVYMSYVSYRPGLYSNYAVVKYNNDGVQQWIADYNNGGDGNIIYNMTVDAKSNASIYVTGKSGGSIATVKFVQTPTQINQSTNNIIPDSYWLGQNFPNPFNPKTVIQYHIPVKGLVSLKVFDVLGNEVAQLLNGNQEAGSYEAEFDGSGFASGIYFYSLYLNESLFDTKRMVLLK